jgi:hypothetical protein
MPPQAESPQDVEMQPLVLGDASERSQTKKPVADKDDDDDAVHSQGKNKWSLKNSGGIKALSACGLYSFCSVSMILVNKSLASGYNHLLDHGDLNILLVVIQAIVAVICVEACKNMKIIEAYPPLTWETVKGWAPVNIFFCLMLFTGMASLQTNSVPMVTVFKVSYSYMVTCKGIECSMLTHCNDLIRM